MSSTNFSRTPHEDFQDPFVSWRFGTDGGDTDDAVVVGKLQSSSHRLSPRPFARSLSRISSVQFRTASGSPAAALPPLGAGQWTTSGRPWKSHCVGSSLSGSASRSGYFSAAIFCHRQVKRNLYKVAIGDLQPLVDPRNAGPYSSRINRRPQIGPEVFKVLGDNNTLGCVK